METPVTDISAELAQLRADAALGRALREQWPGVDDADIRVITWLALDENNAVDGYTNVLFGKAMRDRLRGKE